MGADAMPSAKPTGDASEVAAIGDWILRQGLASDDLPGLLSGFCERIVALGVPLWRGHLSLATLHPMYEAIGYSWRRTQGLTHDQYGHGDDVDERSEGRLQRYRHRPDREPGDHARARRLSHRAAPGRGRSARRLCRSRARPAHPERPGAA